MAITFKIAARTLRHLGAELITSEEMALNELMKNAFDAMSPRVKIEINYPVALNLLENNIRKYTVGHISKEDLLFNISENSKLYHHETKPCSDFLDRLEVFIDKIDSSNIKEALDKIKQQYFIRITDTGHGMDKDDLENVFMTIGTSSKLNVKQNGDRVLLGEKGIGRLSMMKLGNIAIVKSKTQNEKKAHEIKFDWSQFDEPKLFLDEIKLFTNEIESDFEHGTQIEIKELTNNWTLEKTEQFVREYIQRLKNPFNQDPKDFPIDIYQNNKRLAIPTIPKHLTEAANFEADYVFKPSEDDNNIALVGSIKWQEASQSKDLRSWTLENIISRLDETKQKNEYQKIKLLLNKLGPLTIKAYWFNRADFKKSLGYKPNWKKELDFWVGGFGVYRDGFRVGFTGGLNDDWLAMDRASLVSSGYSFNRYQTIGVIEISKITNSELKDSANRETLIGNEEFTLLKNLMTMFVVNDIRFRINEHKVLQDKIDKSDLLEKVDTADNSYKNANSVLINIKKQLSQENQTALTNIELVMKNQNELINSLRAEIDQVMEKNTDILELAGLGQMIDFIGHELKRVTINTSSLLDKLKYSEDENQINAIIVELQKQIKATQKRIDSIDVLSPATRQRKETYNIVNQFKTIIELYDAKFKRHNVNVTFTVDEQPPKEAVNVKMVRGLVAQIIENLLTNSVYWLDQGVKIGNERKSIEIDIDSKAKTIFVRDNGPGIAPEHRHEIFKAYFTNRAKGKGLGLYIASEIAAYHKAQLYLLNETESDNRLRTFVLELPSENNQ
jgi:signal transduction histidine kinase